MQSPESPTDHQHLLRLNVTKADPILRLLMADVGYETGDFGFNEAWPVFKRFMNMPVDVVDGGGTFQLVRAEGDPRTVEVFIGRELSQQTESMFVDTRVVGMYFVLSPSGLFPPEPEVWAREEDEPPDEIAIWSGDFSNFGDFVAAVEASIAFRVASTWIVTSAVFYSQEDTNQEGE